VCLQACHISLLQQCANHLSQSGMSDTAAFAHEAQQACVNVRLPAHGSKHCTAGAWRWCCCLDPVSSCRGVSALCVVCTYVDVCVPAGRLASSNPNMQAVPAHDERGRLFKAAFTADDGHLLVAADYSQVGASASAT
jgi:hypothetical protein